ncbi:uncharacterized protein [Clytia hemisphaerica]|uniref:uncharacterized protein n=1 Tax=Clytia hemisphaerica TaxID=252671 RepID=UPI0034D531A5
MGKAKRSLAAYERRKQKKKQRKNHNKKELKQNYQRVKDENLRIMEENEHIKKENGQVKEENIQVKRENTNMRKAAKKDCTTILTSTSKSRVLSKRNMFEATPYKLSSEVVDISDTILGDGAFGKVYLGRMNKIDCQCAVKSGKTVNYFDADHEALILQRLQKTIYFPHLFGVLDDKLVMEYIFYDCGTMTIYNAKNNNMLTQNEWIKVCYGLIKGLVHMHRQGVLHNDIKSNNVMLKSNLVPVFIDFGKATLRKCPEIYRLTEKQRVRYNSKYLYLAYELRNVWGTKTSTATDIYSLGYLYQFVNEKDDSILTKLQSQMQEHKVSKRITSPDILKWFKHWESKQA